MDVTLLTPDSQPPRRKFTTKALALSENHIKLEGRILDRESGISPIRLREPRFSLPGRLGLLAIEVIIMILDMLDLETLGNLRATNFVLCYIVDNLTGYQNLIQRVPNAVQAIADLGALTHFSVRHLHNALLNQQCHLCNALGTILFIPLGRRVCLFCLEYNPNLRMISVSNVKSLFGLSDSDFKNFPTVHTFPGRYGLPYRQYKTTHWLMNASDITDAGLKHYGNEWALVYAADTIHQGRLDEYNRRYSIWWIKHMQANWQPIYTRPSNPRHWRMALTGQAATFNLLCAVTFPPFHDAKRGHKADYRFCQGCAFELSKFINAGAPKTGDYNEALNDHRKRAMRAHTPESLNEHVEKCAGVKKVIIKKHLQF